MLLWKRFILVSILALFSIANSFETISYFYKKINVLAVLDLKDVEENNSESEKSNEKTEKSNEFKNLKDLEGLLFSYSEFQKLHIPYQINFSSADFSQVVYSPPEFV